MLIGNVNMIEQVRCCGRRLGKILIYPYREEIPGLSHRDSSVLKTELPYNSRKGQNFLPPLIKIHVHFELQLDQPGWLYAVSYTDAVGNIV